MYVRVASVAPRHRPILRACQYGRTFSADSGVQLHFRFICSHGSSFISFILCGLKLFFAIHAIRINTPSMYTSNFVTLYTFQPFSVCTAASVNLNWYKQKSFACCSVHIRVYYLKGTCVCAQ